ncbi:hypothetical protein EDC04DRAFT_2712278 [Pisolithus marmoratus]|nr:hypothetical protein EDC04DRAFT_2712278 [Pisolithus marmoratus]
MTSGRLIWLQPARTLGFLCCWIWAWKNVFDALWHAFPSVTLRLLYAWPKGLEQAYRQMDWLVEIRTTTLE